MPTRYFDETKKPMFKSLGKFRISQLKAFEVWYASKFCYNPAGDPNVVYEAYKEFDYDGEEVMTLVRPSGFSIGVIPKRFLEKVG